MASITVYHYEVYDIVSDRLLLANRMGTREGIALLETGYKIIEDSRVDIDDKLLGRDAVGMTDIGFTRKNLYP